MYLELSPNHPCSPSTEIVFQIGLKAKKVVGNHLSKQCPGRADRAEVCHMHPAVGCVWRQFSKDLSLFFYQPSIPVKKFSNLKIQYRFYSEE